MLHIEQSLEPCSWVGFIS